MKDKELKKLRRTDLIELMIAQSKEIDRLNAELQAAQQKLADRNLAVSSTGNMADAAIQIYHVLASAQKAADLYLENVKRKADTLK